MTPAATPTVFVIDDDDLVRAAIQGMLKSVGLRCETFGKPQEFLRSKRPDGPSCLILDVRLPGISGLDFQRESDSHHFHHWARRYSDDRKGHEIRCGGVPDEAFPGPGLAGCDPPGFGSRPRHAPTAERAWQVANTLRFADRT